VRHPIEPESLPVIAKYSGLGMTKPQVETAGTLTGASGGPRLAGSGSQPPKPPNQPCQRCSPLPSLEAKGCSDCTPHAGCLQHPLQQSLPSYSVPPHSLSASLPDVIRLTVIVFIRPTAALVEGDVDSSPLLQPANEANAGKAMPGNLCLL
jgi:hypothetical protein